VVDRDDGCGGRKRHSRRQHRHVEKKLSTFTPCGTPTPLCGVFNFVPGVRPFQDGRTHQFLRHSQRPLDAQPLGLTTELASGSTHAPQAQANGKENESSGEEEDQVETRERQRPVSCTTHGALHSSTFSGTGSRLLREGNRRPDKESRKRRQSRRSFHSLPLIVAWAGLFLPCSA
jgi:hypothetical protein